MADAPFTAIVGERLILSTVDPDVPDLDVVVAATFGNIPEGGSFDVFTAGGTHMVVTSDDVTQHRVGVWRKCGWCSTLLPTPSLHDLPDQSRVVGHIPWRRRNESGKLLCGDCTDRSQDIEQEAAEAEYAEHAHDEPREM